MERLYRLFRDHFGVSPESVIPITGSASSRGYFRMGSGNDTCIGVVGTDEDENRAFVGLARHFGQKGLPVPKVYAVSDDEMAYIQEDLGDVSLYAMLAEARRNGEGMEEVKKLLVRTMSLLPKIQFEGADGLDFSICHPQQVFDRRSVMFDLNYFKYCFLKSTGIEFNEIRLQDEFERFADDLVSCTLSVKGGSVSEIPAFLYRDFQARNVMVRAGEPYFIDFQSGRKGPVYYDVASFVWQSRAGYDDHTIECMIDSYMDSLARYVEVDRNRFMEDLRLFRLFRHLQVLGAYGFRGWVEQKADFVTVVPAAVEAIGRLVEDPYDRYPYLMSVIGDIVRLPRFAGDGLADGRLEVSVYSFSYKKGIPHDPTGNGGGYVFDCRSLNNPGRHIRYKNMTGRDEPVIRFLEEDGGVFGFLDHVYGVLDPHIETFMNRGFTSLMLSFGCTGGQHRSVYCAEQAARHIVGKYPQIRVRLVHREQNITEMFGHCNQASV